MPTPENAQSRTFTFAANVDIEARHIYADISHGLQQAGLVRNRKRGNNGRNQVITQSRLQQFERLAKIIPRCITPFIEVKEILWAGASDLGPQTSSEDAGGAPLSMAAVNMKKARLDAYHLAVKYCPALKDMVALFKESGHKQEWNNFLDFISHEAGQARCNDSSGLKWNVEYILIDPERQNLSPKITKVSRGAKIERGFNHPDIARALCPIKLRWDLETDESLLTSLKKGVKAKDWPAFVYPRHKYDRDNIEEGLMRGEALPRVMRHIWTSPTSSSEPVVRVPGGSNAAKLQIKEITGPMIAYCAVQTRFMICQLGEWHSVDQKFDAEVFFNRIVKLFEDPDDEWTKSTLQWWQKQVFLDGAIWADDPSEDEHSESDNEDTILERQRAARRSRIE